MSTARESGSPAPQAQGRFAVYWAPEASHPLWAAGCAWLGRDPSAPPAPAALPRAHVAAPARYGFHATLQAPMRLAEGVSLADLRGAVTALAARQHAFAMPALEVAWLHDFLALRPVQAPAPAHPLRQLADACVRQLDALRARPAAAELARRTRDGGLDDAQQALLARWGYPHVFDHWRFHMTLSERFGERSAPDAERFAQAATRWFADSLAQPLRGASVCIFHEAAAGAPFQLIERMALRTEPA